MMQHFVAFGTMRDKSPESPEATALAAQLQQFITENFYTCSDAIFCSLADMYAAGGDFTENIDNSGGEGTALFACKAIHAMVAKKERA